MLCIIIIIIIILHFYIALFKTLKDALHNIEHRNKHISNTKTYRDSTKVQQIHGVDGFRSIVIWNSRCCGEVSRRWGQRWNQFYKGIQRSKDPIAAASSAEGGSRTSR